MPIAIVFVKVLMIVGWALVMVIPVVLGIVLIRSSDSVKRRYSQTDIVGESKRPKQLWLNVARNTRTSATSPFLNILTIPLPDSVRLVYCPEVSFDLDEQSSLVTTYLGGCLVGSESFWAASEGKKDVIRHLISLDKSIILPRTQDERWGNNLWGVRIPILEGEIAVSITDAVGFDTECLPETYSHKPLK